MSSMSKRPSRVHSPTTSTLPTRSPTKAPPLSGIAKLIGVPLAEVATIGDGDNDVAMFERSGLSIAMGNASPEVQRAADFVTGSNSEDGFAAAIERFILGTKRSDDVARVSENGRSAMTQHAHRSVENLARSGRC